MDALFLFLHKDQALIFYQLIVIIDVVDAIVGA